MGPLVLSAIIGLGGDVSGASAQVLIALTGDAERKTVAYDCPDVPRFSVEYVNVAPNFLAIVPVAGDRIVFAGVTAASGARYVAGPYEWWAKGSEATFSDIEAPDATPVTCLEVIETP